MLGSKLERNHDTNLQIAAAIPLSLVVVLSLQSQARRELIFNTSTDIQTQLRVAATMFNREAQQVAAA